MQFEFATASHIIFGPGTINQVAPLAAGMGHRAFVVIGRNTDRINPLLEQLNKNAVETVVFNVAGEPTTSLSADGVKRARDANCDMVIGMGGGSVLDTGKVIAALLTNEGEPLDYLEVIGRGKTLTKAPAPYIAVPTTAGTGSEVTRNAVLASPQHKIKASMRSQLMLPRLAVVDPVLTHSMSPEVTASTGLDALTQVMEPYVSNKTNPIIGKICREGLKRVAKSLLRAYKKGDDAEAREDMAMASLFGGLALANAKLGAVHGFAGPIGGMLTASHGKVCARLLPYVMEVNVRALQERMPHSPALTRYDEIARLVTGKSSAKAPDGVVWIHELCRRLNVPRLGEFGLRKEDFPTLVQNAKKASSMKGNPIELTDEELMEILEKAI